MSLTCFMCSQLQYDCSKLIIVLVKMRFNKHFHLFCGCHVLAPFSLFLYLIFVDILKECNTFTLQIACMYRLLFESCMFTAHKSLLYHFGTNIPPTYLFLFGENFCHLFDARQKMLFHRRQFILGPLRILVELFVGF